MLQREIDGRKETREGGGGNTEKERRRLWSK